MEELLSPPRLDGEQAEIYDALKRFTNDDIILKYPRSGQYRSAFVVTDLDSEASDEAIVFYEMPNVSDGSSLRMNFLDKQNGRWVSVYDFAASGSEVESVMFSDLGDGSVTILVNYLVQNSSDRSTSVMTYKNGMPEELANIRNVYMGLFDTDGDENTELFTITTDRTSGTSSAAVYGWKDGDFARRCLVELNSGFAGIRDVSCGECDSYDTRAVFIDYVISDGFFSTDAVMFNKYGYYLSPALSSAGVRRSSNSYTPYISCRDADGDGYTEVPVTAAFPGYEVMSPSEQVNMTVWYSLDRAGTTFAEKVRSFVGTKGDYILFLPDSWQSKVTASVSISESTVTFSRFDHWTGRASEEVLRLFGVPEGNSSKYETEEYVFLGTSNSTGYSYFARCEDTDITPTEEELHQLFVIN